MALICVPLVEKTVEEDVRLANSVDCDVVEVRLDYLTAKSGIGRMARIRKPVIATCMPAWEGGLFKGGEEDRVRILESCLPYCRYVTVELKTDGKLRDMIVKKAKRAGVKVIVASHDFRKTPKAEEIIRIIRQERKAGADMAKVAFMAKKSEDVLVLMQALSAGKKLLPVIALSMGDEGRISRVLAPFFGSYLTFAAASKSKVSAPGQLTIEEVKRFSEFW